VSAASVAAPHPALTDEALAAIYAHARREHPNECCGIVYGPKAQPLAARAVACVNIQNELHAEDPVRHTRDARTAYNLGAGDLFKLAKSLRGDEPAKIVYHSHVDVERADGAYFSDTDQAAAQMDGEPTYPVEYVVVDVRRDGVRGAAQFAWDGAARRYVEIGRYPGPRESQ
jgi:proteasome lid subunit RPN8/RPN11